MTSKVMMTKEKNDKWIWLLVLGLLLGAIIVQFVMVQYPPIWRLLGALTLLGVSLWIGAQTKKGSDFIKFWQAAVLEVRKSTWPTRQETVQMTIAVVAMVFIMGLLLWGIDVVLAKMITALTGRWGN